jgi:cysteine desulfurase
VAISPIYLDYNASTPVAPEVLDAMLPYLSSHYGNPSSTHAFGKDMREAIEQARSQVAELIGSKPEEICFTSGGTESNNLAIRGVAAAQPERRHLLTSAIEHPATLRPCELLQSQGYAVDRVPVNADGQVRLDSLAGLLRDDTVLVSLMHANGETGVIQPVRKVAEASRRHGALMHTDAAQSLGKIAVNVDELGVDLLSMAGHKMYAPVGVGALYVRSGTPIEPLLAGAGHERGLRPGTENTAGIVGLGAACVLAGHMLGEEIVRLSALRDRLWERLKDRVPGIELNGDGEMRLPNTLSVRFLHVSANALLARCRGIAASTGSACHATHENPSEVITAMGIVAKAALGTVRLSLGRFIRQDDIDAATDQLSEAWTELACGPPRPEL